MSKNNIIIGSKLGDGNILIGTMYGGFIPTTTTTTTSTTTTTTTTSTTTTTTSAPPNIDVDFVIFSATGSDGSAFSQKCWNISTPGIGPGECYDMCLRSNLHVDISQVDTGSYACFWVSCNMGMCCNVHLCANQCIDPIYTCINVKYGDTIVVYNEAFSSNIACAGYISSQTCICAISSVVGSFLVGTTCCCVCAYTG